MVARSPSKRSRGFSLVEMLIVVATIGALTSLSLALFETFLGSSSTHLTADKLIDALGHARISSLSQKQDGVWGVKLLPMEQKAVVFLGSSYAARNAAFDTEFPYEDGVSVVSQLGPPPGADEVVFSGDTGTPSAHGTIVITAGGVQREVVVELTEVGIALKRGDKLTICHYPPGNPGHRQTISISPNAWPAHKKQHGDTMGPCPPTNLCGNGICDSAAGEACDQGPGNGSPPDSACSTSCQVNPGCTCVPPVCVDGEPSITQACSCGL